MATRVYGRAPDAEGEVFTFHGESEYDTPVFAVQDVNARENGDTPSPGEEYVVHQTEEDTVQVIRITTAVDVESR